MRVDSGTSACLLFTAEFQTICKIRVHDYALHKNSGGSGDLLDCNTC
jgi:hypothetical protein